MRILSAEQLALVQGGLAEGDGPAPIPEPPVEGSTVDTNPWESDDFPWDSD